MKNENGATSVSQNREDLPNIPNNDAPVTNTTEEKKVSFDKNVTVREFDKTVTPRRSSRANKGIPPDRLKY